MQTVIIRITHSRYYQIIFKQIIKCLKFHLYFNFNGDNFLPIILFPVEGIPVEDIILDEIIAENLVEDTILDEIIAVDLVDDTILDEIIVEDLVDFMTAEV